MNTENIITIITNIAAWYGIACLGFNGLAALVANIVTHTPGTTDDEAVEKFYATPLYRAIAWIFSWGDYLGELITKLKK